MRLITLFILTLLCYTHLSEGSFKSSNSREKEDSIDILRGIYNDLKNAAAKGAEELRDLLFSIPIREKLEKLGDFYRSIANRFLNYFADVLQKLETEIRPDVQYDAVLESEDTIEDLEEINESLSIFQKLREIVSNIERRVRKTYHQGQTTFMKFLKSDELNSMISKLPSRAQGIVRKWIEKLNSGDEFVEKLTSLPNNALDAYNKFIQKVYSHSDEGRNELISFVNTEEFQILYKSLNSQEQQEVDDLLKHLLKTTALKNRAVKGKLADAWNQVVAHSSQGIEAIYKFLFTMEFQNVYDALEEEERVEFDIQLMSLIKTLRQNVKRSLSSRNFRDLWSAILAKHAKGDVYLENFVKGDGFKSVYDSLNSEEEQEVDSLLQQLLETTALKKRAVKGKLADAWNQVVAHSSQGIEAIYKFLFTMEFQNVYDALEEEERVKFDIRLMSLIKTLRQNVKRSLSSRNFRDLWSAILAKHAKGDEYLENFVKGDGFKSIYDSLNSEEKQEVDSLLQQLLELPHFENQKMRNRITKRSDFTRNFRDLWSAIMAKNTQGKEVLKTFVEGDGFKAIYNSLNSAEKQEIDFVLQELLKTLKPIKRSNPTRNFRDLWSAIMAKNTKGKEFLTTFVEGDGFKTTYSSTALI